MSLVVELTVQLAHRYRFRVQDMSVHFIESIRFTERCHRSC